MSWGRDLDRRLKALPGLRAPRGLSSRILAAAGPRSRPWHARPWWTWSPAAQGAFVAALALGVAGLAGASQSPLAEALASAQERLGWLQVLAGALGRAAFTARAPLGAAVAVSMGFCVLPTAALAALPRARFAEKR
ncbi:MAG: hypothetical protein HYZ75_16280 [Elusimicrobia bacterium]|nr:hypothetical protein [Elusimicrobiota bacterium]